jgi:hypothetical protein
MSREAGMPTTGLTLAPFFEATSVAVIGASADPSKVGGSFAALAIAAPALAELEINPLLAGPDGARALDARGRLAEGTAP